MITFQFFFGIFYLFMLKLTSSEKFSFQSYQNKNLVHKNKTTNNNANVAAVIRLTRANTKAKRKRLFLEGLYHTVHIIEILRGQKKHSTFAYIQI